MSEQAKVAASLAEKVKAALGPAAVALEGAKIVPALDREFVFVAVQGRGGRESPARTGSAQIKESAERAAVFAVLDATNRWTELRRPR